MSQAVLCCLLTALLQSGVAMLFASITPMPMQSQGKTGNAFTYKSDGISAQPYVLFHNVEINAEQQTSLLLHRHRGCCAP